MIIQETKLDFDDILLVPQRSPNASRRDVDLNKKYKFYHSDKEWYGLPIMAANMDTTGTFAMAEALNDAAAITCLHKHYSLDSIFKYFTKNPNNHVWISVGMNDKDVPKVINRLHNETGISPNICIDIANGYTQQFVEYCAEIRGLAKNSIIMAGNVCTPEMVQELIIHGGVDIVKVGIGPGSACTTRLKTGCFTGDSLINTSSGLRQIKDIDIGEKVLTHDGSYQTVTQVHNNGFKDNLIEINGIVCTDDHEFYVVNKEDKSKITERNIHNFAYWLEAKDIDEEKHLIIEITD